jgi:hypothetical protein
LVPAPNTSTLVIREVAPSKLSPVRDATAVPTAAATRSANPITSSGTSHSAGER